MAKARILVIKLGALGDFVQAVASFAQIRRAHRGAEITLLTTPPFADFARASGLFDRIETDGRPEGILATARLFRRLRRDRYAGVYDLQTSGRTKNYFYGFLPFPPPWSGISFGASFRHSRPDRDAWHNLDRMADQLNMAGAGPAYARGAAPSPDLSWAIEAARAGGSPVAGRFGLHAPFALIAPGAAPTRPEKFWPVEGYALLAARLLARGLAVGVVGGGAERPLAQQIRREATAAVDLTGRTSLVELAGLGAEAALAIGNDSGPVHMMAYAGAPGLMLMSRASEPSLYAPRARVRVLRRGDLKDLDVEDVWRELQSNLAAAGV